MYLYQWTWRCSEICCVWSCPDCRSTCTIYRKLQTKKLEVGICVWVKDFMNEWIVCQQGSCVLFSSGSYEPPLTNVFTMQWFLTMFATCLPTPTVLKIWDSVFFEGSEVLFRVALAIWERLGEWVDNCWKMRANAVPLVLLSHPHFLSFLCPYVSFQEDWVLSVSRRLLQYDGLSHSGDAWAQPYWFHTSHAGCTDNIHKIKYSF